MRGTILKVFSIVLATSVLLSLATTGPSSTFSDEDKANLKRILSSSKSFLGNKNTYYTVATLKKLGAEVPDKNKHCESAKAVLSKEIEGRDRAETIFYAVGIAETLGCGQTVGQNVVQELKKALSSNSIEDLYYAVSAATLLHANKHSDGITDSDITGAVNKLVSAQDDDGTFKSGDEEGGNLYNTGLVLKALAAVAKEWKSVDQKSKLSTVLDNVKDFFKEQADFDDDVLYFADLDAKHSPLKITSNLLSGLTSLSSAINGKVNAKMDHLVAAAEYLVRKKHVGTPEDAFSLIEGLEAVSNNDIGVPVVVSLPQASLSSTSKTQSVTVKVSNVLGAPVSGKVVLVKGHLQGKSDKSIVSNQALSGDKGEYSFNFMSLKPEAGFYELEFSVTPTDKKFIAVDSAVRSLKVSSQITVSDVSVTISESGEPRAVAEGRKTDVAYPKSSTEIISATQPEHVVVSFKVQTAAGSSVSLQQAFVRISSDNSEAVVAAKFNGKQYTVDINLANVADSLNGDGKYELNLILGDAFVQNPIFWKIGQLNIKFLDQSAQDKELPFAPKKEIKHLFREAEKRPNASVSFAFTIAAAAPLGLLLIGLLATGNFKNYPTSGLSPIYALGLQVTLGLILSLYAYYWLALNMMQTLSYLGVLGVAFIFFATKALNSMAIVSIGKPHSD